MRNKQWRGENKEHLKEYRYKRSQNDIQYRLAKNLRTRLYRYVNGDRKPGSAVKDLGCTVDELKDHLESQWEEGMTWDNWTIDGWHIDHIKPLVSFDLTDRKQFLEACHYTNLAPLWSEDNQAKQAKMPDELEANWKRSLEKVFLEIKRV